MLTRKFALTCLPLLALLGCGTDHKGAKRLAVPIESANGTTLNGEDGVNQSKSSKGDKDKDKDNKPDPLAPDTGSTAPITDAPNAIFKNCDTNLDAPVLAQLYKLPDNTTVLPDFSILAPIGAVCLNQFDIQPRVWTDGFPGVSADLIEWFAIDAHFKLNIETAGSYTFFLNADDGSILSIDGQQTINDDGLHMPVEKSAVVSLSAGVHDVRLKYFQGPRERIALELSWIVPGTTAKVYVPQSVMARP